MICSTGLKLNPQKCQFAQQKCTFLGHDISKEGIKPPDTKVDIVLNYPVPQNIKELRRALGLLNWFRKFISNYSAIASPLTKLLRKGVKFHWGQKQDNAFNKLKQMLASSPVLSFPRYDVEFRISVDTSAQGIGYMLYQIIDETPRVVRFGSKGLSKWQKSYGPTKLELLGMVTSILYCSSYVRGKHFVIECDHQALRPLFQKQLKGAIYERWLALLQQFSFDIEYKPASQMQVPDALSRNPEFPSVLESSPEEDDPYFPYVNEKPTTIKLPTGDTLQSLLNQNEVSNFIAVDTHYDGDTEDNIDYFLLKKHKQRTNFDQLNKRTPSPIKLRPFAKDTFSSKQV